MKLKTLALAGATLLALCGTAAAGNATGWYLGLGAGWDYMHSFNIHYVPPGSNIALRTDDTALIAGTFGYRFPSRLRVEFELSYDRHDIKGPVNDGHVSLTGAMANVLYDIPLNNRWDLSLGAGAGIGKLDIKAHQGVLTVADGTHTGYMWQAIAETSYSLTRNVDLFIDYRYRPVSVNKDYATSFSHPPGFTMDSARPKDVNEQAAMIGVRWYFEQAEPPPPAPPPPPPPAPPPPPPPPPPPVKTFIVFFDFNKSNLTEEAEAVVQEAVKAAKETGMVKVLITGHTDTVGSHTYNQGLSERRAASVKDEMVREGMEGGTIETVGKSFDDPLVPTGPGVREPQNRRAVIELGDGSGS